MRFRLKTLSTALAADHRLTHNKDRDLDETCTGKKRKKTYIGRKHGKRWVGGLHLVNRARTEIAGV